MPPNDRVIHAGGFWGIFPATSSIIVPRPQGRVETKSMTRPGSMCRGLAISQTAYGLPGPQIPYTWQNGVTLSEIWFWGMVRVSTVLFRQSDVGQPPGFRLRIHLKIASQPRRVVCPTTDSRSGLRISMPNPGGTKWGRGLACFLFWGSTPVRRFGQPIRLEDLGQNPGGTKWGRGFGLTNRFAKRRQSGVRTAKPA